MVPANAASKKSLLLRFALIYLVSILLTAFIIYAYFQMKSRLKDDTAVVSMQEASAAPNVSSGSLFTQTELLYNKYKSLKALDVAYQQTMLDSNNAAERSQVSQNLALAEAGLSTTIDSIEREALKNPVEAERNYFATLAQTFRLVMTDRTAAKIMDDGNAAGSPKPTATQQQAARWQSEIQARDSRIAALQNTIFNLQNKTAPVNGGKNPPAVQTSPDVQNLQSTIDQQQKQITTLTTSKEALEKEVERLNNLLKRPADNTALTTLRNQYAQLQARINQLDADVRFAEVDCNFSRADASQIVSSARQRKNLLNDALGTLKNLSASDDPTVKRKVAEKISKLNQIASSIRD
jgi:hypothetical protein